MEYHINTVNQTSKYMLIIAHNYIICIQIFCKLDKSFYLEYYYKEVTNS